MIRMIFASACVGFILIAAAVRTNAGPLSIPSVYVLSGTVSTSNTEGGATCLMPGTSVSGGAYLPALPHSSDKTDTIVLDHSSQAPLMGMNFHISALPATGTLKYLLPPIMEAYSGTFNMSAPKGTSKSFTFTFEAVTGPLNGGASGSCDTVFSFTVTQGIPKSIKMLL